VCGRRSARDISIRRVRKFPERACIFKHVIVRFAKMILRDRRYTSYFTGWDDGIWWGGKIAKRIGTKPSALPSTCHLWKGRLTEFLELLRFWCCLAEFLHFGAVNFHFSNKSRK
jgi:hypothetical protein